MCIYVNSLIDDPLKITFVDDMVTIKNKAFIIYYILLLYANQVFQEQTGVFRDQDHTKTL